MTKENVLFVLIPEYADWEPSILAAGLRRGFGMWEKTYNVRIAAPTLDPAASIGGFRAIPDCTIRQAGNDFAALVLVGGLSWWGEEAKSVLPLVGRTLDRGAVLGGICDASMFLGVNGFLNGVEHTSNNLEMLKKKGGAAYTGEKRYHADAPSVRDGNIVTANGAGFVEFAMNIFTALEVAPPEKIDAARRTFKQGFFDPRDLEG